jgi:hypothetical protein
MTIDTSGVLQVNDGATAIFVVDGDLKISSKVKILGTGKAVFFARGTVKIDTGAQINLVSGHPSQCVIVGGTPGMLFSIVGAPSTTCAVIFAPTTDVVLDGSAVVYGSVVANSLTLNSSSRLRYDPATVDAEYHSITGGSYQGDLVVTTDHPGGPAL